MVTRTVSGQVRSGQARSIKSRDGSKVGTSDTGRRQRQRESVCERELSGEWWCGKRQIVETDLAQHNNINYYLHTCSLEEPWAGY
jgi:hypothetical protein